MTTTMTTTASVSSVVEPETVSAYQVLTYVPNLIGYVRILLVGMSFVLFMYGAAVSTTDTNHHQFDNNHDHHGNKVFFAAIVLYVCGFVGDLVDGWAARKLQQTSRWGGVLDMVTDRCSTLGLLYILGQYEVYNANTNTSVSVVVDAHRKIPMFHRWSLSGVCLFLQILDVSSHWFQMYATLSLGMHHKSAEGNADKNLLVRWFYGHYWFFGYLCCGAEFTYLLLLVRIRLIQSVRLSVDESTTSTPMLWVLPLIDSALYLIFPGCIAKQIVNLAQLKSACYAIAAHDAAIIVNEKEKKKIQ